MMRVLLVELVACLAICCQMFCDCMIITSVLAGDKKFKTISFDHKFLKPLTFEKEMPLTEFRRHRTLRPPKFDIDVNIPIKLPLEEEYPYEEPKKPVVSDLVLQTGEIYEPSYGKKKQYNSKPKYGSDLNYAASEMNTVRKQLPLQQQHQQYQAPQVLSSRRASGDVYENQNIRYNAVPTQQINNADDTMYVGNEKNDIVRSSQLDSPQQQTMLAQESAINAYNKGGSYAKPYQNYGNNQQEFIPGGFVNLQLSGPTGGPQMTYEDYDREKWAQQLSQAPGAMPYPILNYQQLQNFYGGLGTFTNGLAENRYAPMGILDKLKSHLGLSRLSGR